MLRRGCFCGYHRPILISFELMMAGPHSGCLERLVLGMGSGEGHVTCIGCCFVVSAQFSEGDERTTGVQTAALGSPATR